LNVKDDFFPVAAESMITVSSRQRPSSEVMSKPRTVFDGKTAPMKKRSIHGSAELRSPLKTCCEKSRPMLSSGYLAKCHA
jgi:hypothetical protein